VKTVRSLASILIGLVLLLGGCADRSEQQLRQVQNELEQVLRTEVLDGDIRIRRVSDHLTVVITERLLFDVGSHAMKPDGIEVLKHMGVLSEGGRFRYDALGRSSPAGFLRHLYMIKGRLLMISPQDGRVEAAVEICSKKK